MFQIFNQPLHNTCAKKLNIYMSEDYLEKFCESLSCVDLSGRDNVIKTKVGLKYLIEVISYSEYGTIPNRWKEYCISGKSYVKYHPEYKVTGTKL